MKFSNWILLLLLLYSSHIEAQYSSQQNSVWTFGLGAGINFNTTPATSFNSNINTSEGCASVSDARGQLLFYTDGQTVHDKLGNIMPNGTGLSIVSTASTSQATVVAPVIGYPGQYYIFSLDPYLSSTNYCKLQYAILDMHLNAGLGDIISKNNLLDSNLSEKMITVQGNNCNLWLIVHKKDIGQFKCYELSASGISDAPVLSNVGTFNTVDCYTVGVLKVSPNRTKIVSQSYNIGSIGSTNDCGTELYDFNPSTGVVSNCRVLDSTNTQYGAEFSPDNNKLYCNEVLITGSRIVQYNLSSEIAEDIIASKTTIYNNPSGVYSDLKLAIDNKIYLNGTDLLTSSGKLDCIFLPNYPGALCNYIPNAITLSTASSAQIGLPNTFNSVLVQDSQYTSHVLNPCISSDASTYISSPIEGSVYEWSDGQNSPNRIITAYGDYLVKVTKDCTVYFDTLHVIPGIPDTIKHIKDTTVCSAYGSIELHTSGSYQNNLWNNSATTATITVSNTGIYWVNNFDACNNLVSDTFVILYVPADTLTHNDTTSICDGVIGSVTLSATTGYSEYLWQNGSTASTYNAHVTGTYWVMCASFCKWSFDTIIVEPPALYFYLGADTFICDSTIISYSNPSPNHHLLWSTASTANSITAYEAGTYYLTVSDENCSYTDTINIYKDNFSLKIPDTTYCIDAPFVYAVNVNSPNGWTVNWNDNNSSRLRYFSTEGTYWLEATRANCIVLDTFTISSIQCNCWITIPNAFTPNNDNINDYFHPLIEDACGISDYKLDIFNRWGELVFSTNDFTKGWDGIYKGSISDLGTYMYTLQYKIGNQKKEISRKGDLTLIR